MGKSENLMNPMESEVSVTARRSGNIAIVYADGYLNKLSGEKTERECRRQIEQGCRTLIVNFKRTELVNSIGVSILLGVIDAAQQSRVNLVFSDLTEDNIELFDTLGLTEHISLAATEADVLEIHQTLAILN